ncbi:Carboxylic ester hydrolase [Aphelenchoides besseyi]|nr:Carboxylic ester hydrolase [Aphelenchoides besseyi]
MFYTLRTYIFLVLVWQARVYLVVLNNSKITSNHHMPSPYDCRPFSRGCSFSMITTGNIVVAETNKMVKHLNPQNLSIGSTKEFLRRFTAKDLTTAYKQIGPPMDGASVLRFSPRIDGDFLPMDYPDLVPLFNYLESIAEVDPNNIANFDLNSFRRKVSDFFITKKIWGDRMAEGIERMVDFYVGNRTGGPAFYLDCYTRAIHDCYFAVPAKLEMLTKMRNGWPIYNGTFDRSHFAMQPPKLPINVSTHGTEYVYLFGHLRDVETLFNEADRRYRQFWLRFIVQFVKTVNGDEDPKLEHNSTESEVQLWNEMNGLCDYDLIRQIQSKKKMQHL